MGYEGAGWDHDSDAMHGFDADSYQPEFIPDWFLAQRAGVTVEEYRRQQRQEATQRFISTEFGTEGVA